MTMLDVNAIDLHYGAAQALRAVSLTAEPGKVTCVLGRNGVGKPACWRTGRTASDQQRLDHLRRLRPPGSSPTSGRGTASPMCRRAAKSSVANRRGEPQDRLRRSSVRTAKSRRRVCAVSGAQRHAGPARRRPLGWPAQLAIAARSSRPRLLLLDEPTEGSSPRSSRISAAPSVSRNLGQIAVVLVEQYLDFA